MHVCLKCSLTPSQLFRYCIPEMQIRYLIPEIARSCERKWLIAICRRDIGVPEWKGSRSSGRSTAEREWSRKSVKYIGYTLLLPMPGQSRQRYEICRRDILLLLDCRMLIVRQIGLSVLSSCSSSPVFSGVFSSSFVLIHVTHYIVLVRTRVLRHQRRRLQPWSRVS